MHPDSSYLTGSAVWAWRSCLLGVILGGGCSGPRQRSILRATAAFVKRTKRFSTYLRYWFLMIIVLIIFFELWFFRNFQEWRELLLLPYSFNTVKKKKNCHSPMGLRDGLSWVTGQDLFFSCPLYFFPHSFSSSYFLPLFHCLISILLFPCANDGNITNTRAWVSHFL